VFVKQTKWGSCIKTVKRLAGLRLADHFPGCNRTLRGSGYITFAVIATAITGKRFHVFI